MFVSLQSATRELVRWKFQTTERQKGLTALTSHEFLARLLQSDEGPNERNTATLQTELEQIEAKRTTIYQNWIPKSIEDATALETEILDTEEITFTIAEKITLIKAVLTRPKPPNAQAPPLQPLSVQTSTPVIQPLTPAHQSTSDHSSSTDTPVNSAPQNQSLRSDSIEQTEPLQGHVNTFAGVSQNASRLPKLTLPIFGGDPLKWQTFWDSFDSAVHSNNVLTNVQKLNYLRAHLEG